MHSVSLKFLVGILSFSDYYPFGMQMPGRNDPGDGYRYGYQGSEKDSEMKGSGSSYTTHYRQLDPRLGRWLSTDPELAALPHQSPYCSMDNNPVLHNDVNGDRINYNGHRRAVRAARRNDANFAANWTTVRAQYGGRSQSLTLYRDEDVTNSLEDLVIQDNIKSQAHLPDKNDKTNFLYFNAVTGSDQGKYAVFDVTFEEEFDLSTRAQPGENEFSRNISTSMTGEEFDRWDITSQVVFKKLLSFNPQNYTRL
jgi:RHS repeat-associated protein